MRQKQMRIIKCPVCGCEYLPGEIYYPKHFLGQPKDVVRDSYGKIIGFIGKSMDDTEKFSCYNCNTCFEVVATTNFQVNLIGEDTPHHVTKLQTTKYKLDEN
jgi:hypothetical protein